MNVFKLGGIEHCQKHTKLHSVVQICSGAYYTALGLMMCVYCNTVVMSVFVQKGEGPQSFFVLK